MTTAPDITALARRALDIVNCPHPDVPSDVRVTLLLDAVRQEYGEATWGDVCRRMATLAANSLIENSNEMKGA